MGVQEMKFIDIIAGARPNFMKIAPIIAALDERKRHGGRLDYRLIHTGQHYDKAMSGDFFTQLGIPAPHHNLEVGSGTQAEQTAGIMVRYEKLLLEKRSDLCLVVGDVTSTMACAITAQKLCIPVAHVEGGIRSGDWTMPEEINRMVTDSITNWFFTTSEYANANLRTAGVLDDRIFFVGNTMIDTLLAQMPKFRPPAVWTDAGLKQREYFVLTLHRPANVDALANLSALLAAIEHGTRGLPVIFPVHPRTRQVLGSRENRTTDCGPLPSLFLIDPLGYLEFNYLVQHAKAVITDSGGITEEATVMGVPCMTMRDTTERPETVALGTNELVGTAPAKLAPYLQRLLAGNWKKGSIPPMWDGKAADRIVAKLEVLLT
jgi:UDP-N-acetylglucosamine 2-epimerase (non-hydrolysing)